MIHWSLRHSLTSEDILSADILNQRLLCTDSVALNTAASDSVCLLTGLQNLLGERYVKATESVGGAICGSGLQCLTPNTLAAGCSRYSQVLLFKAADCDDAAV